MGPLPRRLLAAAAAVVVLVAGGGYLFLASRDAPPAARLRPGGGAGGSGRPDGEWVVAPSTDGFVGYRVRERLGSISAPNDVVGRSPAVSGTVTIAGGAVTGAEVTVDMTRLRTDVEPRDERMRDDGLETGRFPTASFRLGRPVPLGDVTGAKVVRLRLPGTLTLHGVARSIEFPVEARWDGATIQVAGGTRVRRADFGLEVPNLVGYRIEDTGVVELELTLIRKGAALAGPVSTLRRSVAVPKGGGGEPGRPHGRARPHLVPRRPPDRRHHRRRPRPGRHDQDRAHHPRRVAAKATGRHPDLRQRAPLVPGRPPPGRLGLRRPANEDVALIDPATGRFRRLTSGPSYEHSPAWSPDGTRLSFVRDGNLHITRPDGSGSACVRTGMLLTSGARWRPSLRDGRRVAGRGIP